MRRTLFTFVLIDVGCVVIAAFTLSFQPQFYPTVLFILVVFQLCLIGAAIATYVRDRKRQRTLYEQIMSEREDYSRYGEDTDYGE